jgi:phi LC3 family holin
MKVNWKARFKNKVFLISFLALLISFVYNVLGMFEIVVPITESQVSEFVTIVVNVLGVLGVVVDPTTQGINDSERALTYCTENDVREVENDG